MPVCYAIYMNIYLVLSCLIKSRGVVLVLCAFVSQSSCCMWPLTRTVFLPYEKFQLCSLSSRQRRLPLLKSLSTLCLFQFCVIARQTACVYSSLKAVTRTCLFTWILCFTWHRVCCGPSPHSEWSRVSYSYIEHICLPNWRKNGHFPKRLDFQSCMKAKNLPTVNKTPGNNSVKYLILKRIYFCYVN